MCHGWASSPVSFIIENIVGFKGVNEKTKTVYLKPFVDELDFFEASFCCSLGKIEVSFQSNEFSFELPNGVKVEFIK